MTKEKFYFLKINAIGNYPKLSISLEDYNSIIRAQLILSAALSIEEKYDLTLSNFLDLEKELLVLTVDRMARVELGYENFYQIRSVLNRKLSNFILSGKMYTEQIASDAVECLEDGKGVQQIISELRSEQYDSSIEYRTMEALRNHLAHSGMVVHKVSLPSHWTPHESKKLRRLEFNIDIFAEKKILAENSRFKRKVLAELPEYFDLKKGARSYMASISVLQDATRKFSEEDISRSRAVIEHFINLYSNFNQGESFALGAFCESSNPTEKAKPITLMLDWDDVRRTLKEKNDSITNMHIRYATNSISENTL